MNHRKQLNTEIRHNERAYFQKKIRPLFLCPFSKSRHIENKKIGGKQNGKRDDAYLFHITVIVKSYRWGEGKPEDVTAEDLEWIKNHPEAPPIRWTQGGFMMNREGEAPTLRILNGREKTKNHSTFKAIGVTAAVFGSIAMIPRPFFWSM